MTTKKGPSPPSARDGCSSGWFHARRQTLFIANLPALAGFDNNRGSRKAEPRADAVLEVALDGEMELLSADGEGNKHGGRNTCLSEVVKLQGLASRAGGAGYAIETQVLEETIHLRRGHARASGFRHLCDRLQEFSQAQPVVGGDESKGRVVQ